MTTRDPTPPDPRDHQTEPRAGEPAGLPGEIAGLPGATAELPDEPDSLDRASACAPPVRDRLASAVDKAHVFAALFGAAPAEVPAIDRFRLVERVGGGAMGDVYAAHDPRLDRTVAIKLVRRDPDGADSDAAEQRLLREAKTMAQVTHRHVVRVYDAGTYDGRVYIAMEYVDGSTLGRWLERLDAGDRDARQREVVRIFSAAGRGLAAAHAAGLVHRDFKPDNVLVGEDGEPRVGDFGLARRLADQTPRYGPEARPGTRSTAGIAGTPRYMSPEQWRGQPPDARSDQFSFCVALYEALLGRLPFAGATHAELADSVTAGALRAPPAG